MSIQVFEHKIYVGHSNPMPMIGWRIFTNPLIFSVAANGSERSPTSTLKRPPLRRSPRAVTRPLRKGWRAICIDGQHTTGYDWYIDIAVGFMEDYIELN